MARRKFIAGNWKMNKTMAEAEELMTALLKHRGTMSGIDVAVCPAFTVLQKVVDLAAGSPIKVGAQNVHWELSGAFTGEVSVPMLKELPVDYAIIGHSERRQYFGETDATVNKRLNAALDGGLLPIVCIGETLDQREADETRAVVERQLRDGLAGLSSDSMQRVTLAYEPVWAIGTGRTATPDQAQEVHAFIRSLLRDLFGDVAEDVRIQYGGSVKPGNAAELMGQPDIDGALVGGASLKAADFAAIIANSQ